MEPTMCTLLCSQTPSSCPCPCSFISTTDGSVYSYDHATDPSLKSLYQLWYQFHPEDHFMRQNNEWKWLYSPIRNKDLVAVVTSNGPTYGRTKNGKSLYRRARLLGSSNSSTFTYVIIPYNSLTKKHDNYYVRVRLESIEIGRAHV